MKHFVSKYGLDWPSKEDIDVHPRKQSFVPLSTLKKGECFAVPYQEACRAIKLSDENLYFNIHGYDLIPHTIEHEDPNALVVPVPEVVWDFHGNSIKGNCRTIDDSTIE